MPTAAGRWSGRAWARGAGLVTEAASRQAADYHPGQYHDGACAPRAGRSAGYRKNLRQAATGGAGQGRAVADQSAAMSASAPWRQDPGQGGEPLGRSRESTVEEPGGRPRARLAESRPTPRWCWRLRSQGARSVRDVPGMDQPAWDSSRAIAPPRSGAPEPARSARTRAPGRARARCFQLRPSDNPSHSKP